MNYDNWKQETPPQFDEEKQPEKCEACLEETDFRTELGIYRLNLNPKSMVCASCLDELHNELIINTTE